MRNTIVILFAFLVQQPVLAAGNNLSESEGIVSYEQQYQQSEADTTAVEASPDIQKLRINNEFWYIILLGLLCIVSLVIVLSFLKYRDHTAKDIVNAAGLTLIIFGTIILVLVVSTSEQLTAAIGILGAIAGYLFRSVQNYGEAEKAGNE